ncbi:hypothetical protein HQ533_02935 [Candidatus Woesearchaeota archaeon]|nr:hypothetical protein [Candidatus Woesearchaeota archaeon]
MNGRRGLVISFLFLFSLFSLPVSGVIWGTRLEYAQGDSEGFDADDPCQSSESFVLGHVVDSRIASFEGDSETTVDTYIKNTFLPLNDIFSADYPFEPYDYDVAEYSHYDFADFTEKACVDGNWNIYSLYTNPAYVQYGFLYLESSPDTLSIRTCADGDDPDEDANSYGNIIIYKADNPETFSMVDLLSSDPVVYLYKHEKDGDGDGTWDCSSYSETLSGDDVLEPGLYVVFFGLSCDAEEGTFDNAEECKANLGINGNLIPDSASGDIFFFSKTILPIDDSELRNHFPEGDDNNFSCYVHSGHYDDSFVPEFANESYRCCGDIDTPYGTFYEHSEAAYLCTEANGWTSETDPNELCSSQTTEGDGDYELEIGASLFDIITLDDGSDGCCGDDDLIILEDSCFGSIPCTDFSSSDCPNSCLDAETFCTQEKTNCIYGCNLIDCSIYTGESYSYCLQGRGACMSACNSIHSTCLINTECEGDNYACSSLTEEDSCGLLNSYGCFWMTKGFQDYAFFDDSKQYFCSNDFGVDNNDITPDVPADWHWWDAQGVNAYKIHTITFE